MIAATVRVFNPEKWGEIDYFKRFYRIDRNFSKDAVKRIGGVGNHFKKAKVFYSIATKLSKNIELDDLEFNEKGYTTLTNSTEFSAVIEEVFTELYSSIDCARKIISSIYSRTRGMPDSTRKFFKKIQEDKFGVDFPFELKEIVKSAYWFDDLRIIRDELTHSDIGECRKHRDSNAISYSHRGINTKENVGFSKTEDILKLVDDLIAEVNGFLGKIFFYINSQIEVNEIDELCGIFDGRAYLRRIETKRPLTFDSGYCLSNDWFEKQKEFLCPFVDSCGAYKKKKSFEIKDL